MLQVLGLNSGWLKGAIMPQPLDAVPNYERVLGEGLWVKQGKSWLGVIDPGPHCSWQPAAQQTTAPVCMHLCAVPLCSQVPSNRYCAYCGPDGRRITCLASGQPCQVSGL